MNDNKIIIMIYNSDNNDFYLSVSIISVMIFLLFLVWQLIQ